MIKKNNDIADLIEKAKKKDQKAFNTLLNTYWSDVYRFQFLKTEDEDEAEDITIKTFAKAFDKINLYNNRYNFKTWLISISKNIFLDHLRKQRTDTISINKINALEGNTIEISGKKIPIGRNYLKQTKERIFNINEEDKS